MATVDRLRVNGQISAREGQTFDDRARSQRDVQHAPFRQEFLGGGKAPVGYIISFADVPSFGYGPNIKSAEWDSHFVSTVHGPGGSGSVSWSISARVTNGKVTKNTVT
jgi:hypothetical protein